MTKRTPDTSHAKIFSSFVVNIASVHGRFPRTLYLRKQVAGIHRDHGQDARATSTGITHALIASGHREMKALFLGVTQFKTPFVVSPSAPLRTGLSNHERPFDRLRANGLNHISKALATLRSG
jgi:hypothetical protein